MMKPKRIVATIKTEEEDKEYTLLQSALILKGQTFSDWVMEKIKKENADHNTGRMPKQKK